MRGGAKLDTKLETAKVPPPANISPVLTASASSAKSDIPEEKLGLTETANTKPDVNFTSSQTLAPSPPLEPALEPELEKNPKKRKFRIFSCSDCEKSFTQQAHLSIHQRKHTGERPYICGFAGCSKSFTQLGNLKTHERKHTGERPFECSHPGCDKRFSQLGNMKTHEQLHLGIKPFKCPVEGCEKSFTQLGNLKSHQIKVHERKTVIPQQKLPIRKRRIQVDRKDSEKPVFKNDSGLDILVEGSAFILAHGFRDIPDKSSVQQEEAELLAGIKAVISKQM